MSEPIGPGDLVECIEVDEEAPGVGGRGYAIGEICMVEEVGGRGGSAWLNCVGKIRPRECGINYRGWATWWFRPISRRSSFESFLTEIKAPRDDVSAPEREPVTTE